MADTESSVVDEVEDAGSDEEMEKKVANKKTKGRGFGSSFGQDRYAGQVPATLPPTRRFVHLRGNHFVCCYLIGREVRRNGRGR